MSSPTFGQIVREARLERHLSMGQLAAAVDRSTASVRRWERDDGLPTPEVVEALVMRLGLDRDDVDGAISDARVDEPPEAEPDSRAASEVIEEGDPIDVVPQADDAGAEWQQPVLPPVAVAVSRQAPVWPTASVPVAVIEQKQNILQILRDPERPWLGYIRAALTLVVLAGLGWVLLWAVPEFLDAFSDMWDSLWQSGEIPGVSS